MFGPIDQQADEPKGAEIVDHHLVIGPGMGGEREADLDPAPAVSKDGLGGAFRGIAADRAATDTTEGVAEPGPEQAEGVVDLGDGAHGGATRHRRGALLDGHRRRDALETIHQRLGHPLEKLLGVGRQRLDIAALAFGVERVKGEGTLARAGGTRDDHEGAPGELYRDALQVVLAGVDDADL